MKRSNDFYVDSVEVIRILREARIYFNLAFTSTWLSQMKAKARIWP
jgi:hypothetical protein